MPGEAVNRNAASEDVTQILIDTSQVEHMMENLQSRIDQITDELVSLPGRKPANQKSMAEGEINLF